ncbi:hypothetical protein UMM65_00220 [Aureibaculum sp. 2210JD6-5]|uniref:hypothetical protein n=1 Tax=Aureibaculum sp. 2210JD6-5 TaxID=3103957 RepID=UPI002AAEAA53|nr:hypothetical protein [Aureibaculum sp. 2210JD6-5]MDY7393653.1 hypothetical protein [Aureibaculum sp. 2210JD6-5]
MKIFTEQQRFNQWWLYVIIGASLFTMIIPIVINSDDLLKDKTAKIALSISFLLVLATIFIIRMIKLHTRIDEKGIHYRFTPFHRKQYLINWDDVSNAYVRKYNAIFEYGGWGYRGNFLRSSGKVSNGKAYNIRGNQGIQIVLNNGKKILIGTQKEVEAQRVLNTYKSKIVKATA